VGFIISLEWMRINDNDGALDESLSTNQLVIGSIVGDIEDANLAGGNLSSPRKVTRFELEGTKLLVSSSTTNLMNAGLANLGHGRRTAQFKLALLAKLGTTASCLTALVATFTTNTLEEDNKNDGELQVWRNLREGMRRKERDKRGGGGGRLHSMLDVVAISVSCAEHNVMFGFKIH
jgi:hypothetical protein